MKGLIIGASIGNCVHVAGVINFLKLAEEKGYRTKFLGPATSINYLLNAVEETDPDMVALGYRLTPESALRVFKSLKNSIIERGLNNYKFIFGGTLPVAIEAQKVEIFDAIFTGKESTGEIISFLEGRKFEIEEIEYGNNLIERINFKKPYPLIRHHFGLPDLKDTINGVKKIAASKVLDIISLGPDQNAQESFFRPEEINEDEKGAGGVPIRKKQDLIDIYRVSRRGNFPLMRSYSGTRDVFKMAKLLLETIHNAWAAIPLSWYNKLDGRGPRGLYESIIENQELMKWHAKKNIPVEVNESHHWSLRDAHDSVAVAMAYLAAYNAKIMGVKTYIAQYMFNNPATTSATMDLAKMLAKKELIEGLEDDSFKVLTQVRAGLASFPTDLDKAKGQLAYSTFLSMAIKPEILHVVGYSEADHAAESSDLIESCKIAGQVIKNTINNYPDFTYDQNIINRRDQLLAESKVLLNAIKNIAGKDIDFPLADASVISKAIKTGIIDAPHLKGNPVGAGILKTKMIDGACYAYDYDNDKILNEDERINNLIKGHQL